MAFPQLALCAVAWVSMPALPEVTLPETLTDASFSLTIEADATMGAIIDTITVDGFDHVLDIDDTTNFGTEADKRIWNLETRDEDHIWGGHGQLQSFQPDGSGGIEPVTAEALIPIGPDAAASFQAYDATTIYGGVKAILLEWSGVDVGSNSTLWIRVLVHQGSAPAEGVRFASWFGRERGESISVPYLVCPHFYIGGPVATHAGDSPYESQGWTRVLVPSFLSVQNPQHAMHNTPMPAWHGFRVSGPVDTEFGEFISDHPAPAQMLQFFAIAPWDTADATSYKKLLYVQTEDADGYQKSFRYQGLRKGTGLSAECWFRARVAHIPGFERGLGTNLDQTDHATDPHRVQDEYGNSYATPYATFVGGFESGDHFWFDCCDRYRTWAETAFSLTDRVSIPNRPYMLSEPFVHLITATFQGDVWQGENYTDAIYDEVVRVRELLANDHVDVKGVLHLQMWLPDGYGVRNGGDPVTPGVDIAWLARNIATLGFRLSVYSRYLGLNDPPEVGWDDSERSVYQYNYPHLNTTDYQLDVMGSDVVSQWWLDNIYTETIGRTNSSAAYLDVTVGNGNVISYPTTGPDRVHNGHGGNYGTTAKLKFIQNLRTLMETQTYEAHRLGITDTDAPIQTESWEEGVSHEVDWMQSGLDNVPGSLTLAEPVVLLDQFGGGDWPTNSDTTSPLSGRDPNPPLAEAVYKKFYALGRLQGPTERGALGTERNTHSATSPAFEAGRPGLSAAEFIDMHAYWRAILTTAGTYTTSHAFWIDDLTCLMSNPNATDDPSNAGLTVWTFIKELYESCLSSYAGQFLVGGELEEPLLVDFLDLVNNTEETNPCFTADQECSVRKNLMDRTDWRSAGSGVTQKFRCTPIFSKQGDVELGTSEVFVTDPLATPVKNFEVKQMVHGMFSSPTGQLGMVLINWSSNASATFQADFDPENYGIGALAAYSVDKLTLGGSPVSIASGIAGVETFYSGGTGTVDLGAVGVRSIEVFTITED